MNQILDKISKALKLGTNNNNENEAQNAILMAQKLMAKYHLSQEDVDSFLNENESKNQKVIEERAENEINNEKWKRLLMITIAKNFRCGVFYVGSKLILVGEKEDILISKRVYLYAKKSILNTFKKYINNNYQDCCLTDSIKNKYKREFAIGFIKGLSEKFEEQKANSEIALVVVNQKVKQYFDNKNFNGVRHQRANIITNSKCYSAGRIEGKNLADIDTRMKGEI